MFFRFLIIGGLGFIIDAGATLALINLGVTQVYARPPSIILAMLFTWLANRAFTYEATRPKSRAELLRYVSVAATTALFNYLTYLGLLALGLSTLFSIVIATALQTIISFHAYRIYVFNENR